MCLGSTRVLLDREAAAIERAVDETIAAGFRTADIVTPGGSPISTTEMGSQITSRIVAA